MNDDRNTGAQRGGGVGWLLGGFALYALVVFRRVLPANQLLFTTDDSLGVLAYAKRILPHGFLAPWVDSSLLGVPLPPGINWRGILMWLLPLHAFVDWNHAINLVLASVFFCLFLRLKGLGWVSVVLGALTAFWLGSNFTLTYAGHLGKFSCLFFAAVALWAIEWTARTRRIAWAIIAGGAVGVMFLEQQDVALFMGLFLGAYALFAVGRAEGWRPVAVGLRLGVMGIMALVLGGSLAFKVYSMNVAPVPAGGQESSRQQWEFCTQWSWPPEESIDFIAPGFMGWRSGEPKGPYWGRMGRSSGWTPATPNGFPNFKLENHYLGAIPVALALWGVLLSWWRRKEWNQDRWMVFFWTGAVLLSLGLAFGKFFPLYRLFYLLPGVDAIRNPNKFLHIFQMGVGILAAYGCEFVLGARPLVPPDARRETARRVLLGLAIAAALLILPAVVWMINTPAMVRQVAAQGWGEAAAAIVSTRIQALLHGGVMVLGVTALLALMTLGARRSNRLLALRCARGLVAVVALDALWLARMYILPLSRTTVLETEMVTYLKENLQHDRLALLSQEGFYNHWLTYLFPYHGIPTLNFTQMPRMPADYEALFAAAQGHPFRLWELTACSLLMGPSQVWSQIQADERYRNHCAVVFAFNVAMADGAPVAVTGTAEQRGEHCLIRNDRTVPRFSLCADWEIVPDHEVLGRLFAPDFEPGAKALVSPATAEGLPSPTGTTGKASVDVRGYRPGRAELQVSTDQPVLLRVAERYSPEWKATVDGQAVPVRKCDHLCQAVLVEPGLHSVILEFAPPRNGVWVQLGCFAVVLGAVGVLILRRDTDARLE